MNAASEHMENVISPIHTTPWQMMRSSTLDIARRIDPILAHLEDTKGFADLRIEIRKGELALFSVCQTYKLS